VLQLDRNIDSLTIDYNSPVALIGALASFGLETLSWHKKLTNASLTDFVVNSHSLDCQKIIIAGLGR